MSVLRTSYATAPIVADVQAIAPQLAVKRGQNSIVLMVSNNEVHDTTSSYGPYRGDTALGMTVRNGCRWIMKLMISRASEVAKRDEDTTPDIARRTA